MRSARRALLALVAFGGVLLSGATSAHADGRFGDSTWVAPAGLFELDRSDSSGAGPRVSPRDSERGWETALRTPFRIVFLPLRFVAVGLEAVAGYAGPRYFEPKSMRPPTPGPKLGLYVTVTSIGDIGIGPEIDVQAPESEALSGMKCQLVNPVPGARGSVQNAHGIGSSFEKQEVHVIKS